MVSTSNERFGGPAVFVIVGLLCLSITPGVVGAQEQLTGGSVVIGPEETHKGDLEATAGDVRIEGTVDGDLTATGGTVTITGDVTGDVTATAGSVIIEGTVAGDLTATGGDVRVRESAAVDGMVRTTGGAVTVDGTVEDDTRLDGDTVRVGPTAAIGGDLTYSADEATISGDAEITGTVTETDRDELGMGPFSGASLPDVPDAVVTPLFGLYLFCANFALGAVLLVAAPRFSARVSEQGTDRPLLSGGVGLLTLLAMPFALGALFLSIIGIPLAFFATYGFVFVLWIGLVYGAFALGTWGLSAFDRGHRWSGLALGLAIVSLANALPYVGFLLVLITLFGLGAFGRALYDWRLDRGDDDAQRPPPYPALEAADE
ncbi:polymer-forming cytoskeletal protein [Natronomonas salsuginis]|jgi:cytoskeletal protein CcmA (bactofilin family)|uniref:Polymer-forming cytoskeletal protein n=1 Tax=Natronomonas salsuginis TaxID=2217661 RepID=A0A4U5J842_9EURY|nr:polymer-forming cytoskeletal protein [Natronomonas salsuginis]